MASSRRSKTATSTGQSKFIGAVPDEWSLFSDNPKDYTVGAPVGFGASSIVYSAVYHPKKFQSLPCALKVLDLDLLPPHSLRLLQRETQLMSLSKHPNVLRVRGSWIDGHKLYIALRLMNSGSVADVIRYGWPGGMEEEVVKCMLKQALQGLNYLHTNGFIHRDIKAANLLIDDDGTVLLGDLGVAASLSDEEAIHPPSVSAKPRVNFNSTVESPHIKSHPPNKIGKRKSFVGTPCWMAPELISGKQYDSKADIWSFGITALELTQGRAPRSREPPAQVLMRTVQDEPPAFKCEGGPYKYSKAFRDVVESCLIKDPSRRPTAAQLLETPFFRSAKRKNYLVGAVLKDLPPLVRRLERRSRQNDRTIHTLESWDFSTSNPTSPERSRVRSGRSSVQPQENTVFDFELDEDDGDIVTDDPFRSSSPQPQSSEEDSSSNPATPEPSNFLPSSSPSYFPSFSPNDYAKLKKVDNSSSAVVEISTVPNDLESVSANSYSKGNSIWGRRKKETKDSDEKERGRRPFVGRILDRAALGNDSKTTNLQRIASKGSINALRDKILS